METNTYQVLKEIKRQWLRDADQHHHDWQEAKEKTWIFEPIIKWEDANQADFE